uniref:Uncharacterized protein n=1 Tax=Rhizophora mucronata TaxID=61149 RepID=A0A2P2Q2V9_RHIMU
MLCRLLRPFLNLGILGKHNYNTKKHALPVKC